MPIKRIGQTQYYKFAVKDQQEAWNAVGLNWWTGLASLKKGLMALNKTKRAALSNADPSPGRSRTVGDMKNAIKAAEKAIAEVESVLGYIAEMKKESK